MCVSVCVHLLECNVFCLCFIVIIILPVRVKHGITTIYCICNYTYVNFFKYNGMRCFSADKVKRLKNSCLMLVSTHPERERESQYLTSAFIRDPYYESKGREQICLCPNFKHAWFLRNKLEQLGGSCLFFCPLVVKIT